MNLLIKNKSPGLKKMWFISGNWICKIERKQENKKLE
jgi:hypothetical protein